MAQSLATPKSELLMHGKVFARAAIKSDNFGISASDSLEINGPTYIKLTDTLGEGAMTLLDGSGNILARFDSRGLIQIQGFMIPVTSIDTSVAGFFWKTAAGVYVMSIDINGHLNHIVPIETTMGGVITKEVNPAGIGSFDNNVKSFVFGPMPKVEFVGGTGLSTPILQILDSAENVVIKVKEDGSLITKDGIFSGIGNFGKLKRISV